MPTRVAASISFRQRSEKSIGLPLIQRSARRLLDANIDRGYAIPVGRNTVLIECVWLRVAEYGASIGVLDPFKDDQGFAKESLDGAGLNRGSDGRPVRGPGWALRVVGETTSAKVLVSKVTSIGPSKKHLIKVIIIYIEITPRRLRTNG